MFAHPTHSLAGRPRSAYRRLLSTALLLLFSVMLLPAQWSGEMLVLDEPGSYLSSTVPVGLAGPSATFTFEAWVYTGADEIPVMASTHGDSLIWEISIGRWSTPGSSGGSVTVDRALRLVDHRAGGALQTWGSTIGLMAEAWNHVAITGDGTTISFYVNGVAAGSATSAATIWRQESSGSTLLVGATWDDAGDSVAAPLVPHGRIDNLILWNTKRTSGEIHAAMPGDYTRIGGTGRVETYYFDSLTTPTMGADLTLHGGARLDASTAPYLALPATFGYPGSDVALLWSAEYGGSSSLLTASIDAAGPDDYLALGSDDSSLTLRQSSITGLSTRLPRTWSLLPIAIATATLQFDISTIAGLDQEKGVIVVSPRRDFSDSVTFLFGSSDNLSTTLQSSYLFEEDTLYATLGGLSGRKPRLLASLGFGPFDQTDDNLDTFRLDSLPTGTTRIDFVLHDPNRLVTIDSVSVAASDPVYSYQMGDLPVGAVLRVVIHAADRTLHFVQPLSIVEQKPSITASNGFESYALYTEKTVTYRVDSLPAETQAVTMKMVDGAGRTIRFVDTNDVVILDSVRYVASGSNALDSASWTVRLDTLDIPLDAQLSVTVEHVGGVPGGTEYLVPLEVVPPRMTVFSSNGFGPFESNEYDRVVNQTTPWSDVPNVSNGFVVAPLPPRTRSVIWRAMLDDSTYLWLDTLASNGVQWLTDATSRQIVMTELPPATLYIQALIDAEGGPEGGSLSSRTWRSSRSIRGSSSRRRTMTTSSAIPSIPSTTEPHRSPCGSNRARSRTTPSSPTSSI